NFFNGLYIYLVKSVTIITQSKMSTFNTLFLASETELVIQNDFSKSQSDILFIRLQSQNSESRLSKERQLYISCECCKHLSPWVNSIFSDYSGTTQTLNPNSMTVHFNTS
ncbi:MAG: hypothetical protein ACXIU2_00715, partial [Cyclobacteriaceae bacterium]